jgi:uncharacterized Zn finger protein (UPF0148 family)
MSDFDKEAERERLREKYEREEAKREVTERMSELLLKGATMTNAHCQECGDPIFRYDGQEFCATCQRTIQRDTGDEGADEGEPADENGDAEEIEVAAPEETRVQFGGEGTEEAEAAEPEPATDGAESAAGGDATDDSTGVEPDRSAPAAQARTDETAQAPRAPASSPAIDGNLADADDSLVRSVTALARRAEATDDLGRQRDLLAATREAAEALSAVREAGR